MIAMGVEDRPMLNTNEQIEHLKKKGVKFELISESDAADYLRQNNNYFKLRAYRKNFPKHPDGEKAGQYINLDFAELKDLSIIDMRMRYVFIHMALDIEHFTKVKLLCKIENSEEDGYQIVQDYFQFLTELDEKNQSSHFQSLKNEINRNRDSVYCGGIISKYEDAFPVWVFIEIISFGTLIHFYDFCAERLGDKDLKDDYYLLMTVKDIRNAAAHSNCIIHEMGSKHNLRKPNYGMLRALVGIKKTQKASQLSNEMMRQMITLLYTHKRLISSEGVHDHVKEELNKLTDRMYRNIEYYEDNENIKASFDFFKKCVDILFG